MLLFEIFFLKKATNYYKLVINSCSYNRFTFSLNHNYKKKLLVFFQTHKSAYMSFCLKITTTKKLPTYLICYQHIKNKLPTILC